MNRRSLLSLTVPAIASFLPSCRSFRRKPGAVPTPAPPPPPRPGAPFDPGPVPRRLPPGIRVSYSSCRVGGNYAAMTFDDGPHGTLTPRLLDMLRDWGIKATFFLIGRNVAPRSQIVRRMVAEGHEVANHSWSHPSLSKLSADAVRSELRRTHQAIVNACGVAPLNYRPPYGAITAAQKQWIAKEFGYPTILWSVDPNDWRDRIASVVSRRILTQTRSGSIVLAHDIHRSTVDAMPATLPVLARRGVRFVTVSRLITLEAAGQAPPLATTRPADPPGIL